MVATSTGGTTAYDGRVSTSTRNPHSAAAPPPTSAKTLKELAKLSPEERIIAQWRAAFGSPVSDDAKVQFTIKMCGLEFALSDVRLWTKHHPLKSDGSASSQEKGKIFLEFFFDGSPSEIQGHEDAFTKAFETMVEQQLQEQRCAQFRQKLAARRRVVAGGGDDAGEGGCSGDADWRSYLSRPVPETELVVKSMREAGCMIRFLVCQTSLSVGASEVLGQIAFQEHFPIDGVEQKLAHSEKPLPQWVYGLMVSTGFFFMLAGGAWWQIMRAAVVAGDALPGV